MTQYVRLCHTCQQKLNKVNRPGYFYEIYEGISAMFAAFLIPVATFYANFYWTKLLKVVLIERLIGLIKIVWLLILLISTNILLLKVSLQTNESTENSDTP